MQNSKREVSSCYSFVYHVMSLSKNWNIENPYFLALKFLIYDDASLNLSNLRIQQEYHFIAKIIQNELNRNMAEIKKNIDTIKKLYELFNKNMRQNEGNMLLHIFFYINLLKFMKYDLHKELLNKNTVSSFIKIYKPTNSNDTNMKRIICLLNRIECIEKEENDNNYDLALNLLYKRLLLSDKVYRDENLLIDYYLNQKEIEKIEINGNFSERSMGKILEITTVIKAICGDGLYLPEIEKREYLSSFAKQMFRDKFNEELLQTFNINFRNKKFRAWILIGMFFFIETVIFMIPSLFDSASLLNLGINLDIIIKLPKYLIILCNGLISISFIYYIEYKSKKRISDEKW